MINITVSLCYLRTVLLGVALCSITCSKH